MTAPIQPLPSREPQPGREYFPLRAADVFAVVAFWSMLAVVSTLSRELDPRIPGLPPRVIGAVVRAAQIEYALWAVISFPLLSLTTRYSVEGGRRLGRVLLFVLLGIAIAIFMDNVLLIVREAVLSPAGRFRRRPPLAALGGFGFLDDLMVYFAVLGAGIARDYFLRYRAGVEVTVRLQAQLAQARLDALRTQLNPHFLFNTLNAVSALVERDPRGTRRMIARLSDLLRYTLEESTDAEVPLHRELDLLDEYVDLMQIRFQGKLDVRIEASGEARQALVPNLLLQPIVENAIKHGVGQLGGGRIAVRAERRADLLAITVTDSGAGPAGGQPGVGISNTNARLRELYGEGHELRLRKVDAGTEAEITLPFHTTPA